MEVGSRFNSSDRQAIRWRHQEVTKSLSSPFRFRINMQILSSRTTAYSTARGRLSAFLRQMRTSNLTCYCLCLTLLYRKETISARAAAAGTSGKRSSQLKAVTPDIQHPFSCCLKKLNKGRKLDTFDVYSYSVSVFSPSQLSHRTELALPVWKRGLTTPESAHLKS